LRTRGTGIVGYNVQTAADAEHHLIVAHDVTNKYSDRGQLFSMAQQAQVAMDVEELEVVADRGCFKSTEILACAEAGIAAIVPRPQTSNNKALGLFDREDSHYIPEDDEYRCPAGERLPKRTTIWDAQTLDGIRTLPDQDHRACEYRDESACARLQFKKSDEHRGDRGTDRRHPRLFYRSNVRYQAKIRRI